MIDTDFDAFSKLMQATAEYFGKPLTGGVIGIYWQGLRDLEIGELRAALNAHVQNPDSGMFMPKIADIRRMVSGTTQDSALVAWSKVDQAIRHVGTYTDVVFDDPIIHRVLHDMGGWILIGSKTLDEMPFVAREFENRYRGFRMRGEVPAYPPVLVGIANAHNRKGGFQLQPVRLIGDSQACARVEHNGTDQPLLPMSSAESLVKQAAIQRLSAA